MSLKTSVALSAACPAGPAPSTRRRTKPPQAVQPRSSWIAIPWWPSDCRRRHQRHRSPLPAAGLFGGLFGSGNSDSSPEAEELLTDDGGMMVPLDADSSTSLDGSSEEPFGPLALLAVGFTQLEFERLQRLLHGELEAHMVRLVPGTTAALSSSLGAALEQDPPPPFEQAPLGTRRVLFLSGMYAAEVMEIIAAVRERGLPDAVFAAAVPNNYERPVRELVQEVFADHQAMEAQRQRQRLEQQQGQ